MKKHLLAAVTFVLMLTADIITKSIVDASISEGQRIYVLGTFVQLTKIYNQGGVFGIMQGHKTFFLIMSIIVFILLLAFYFYEKQKTFIFSLAMGLIFSGAIGNILDRLMDKPGVVDFIYIGVEKVFMWPAFNVADMCIVTGAFLLGYVFWKQEKAALLGKSDSEESE
ncbi:MAG: signal peptidase II [Spirochaetota bacterium]